MVIYPYVKEKKIPLPAAVNDETHRSNLIHMVFRILSNFSGYYQFQLKTNGTSYAYLLSQLETMDTLVELFRPSRLLQTGIPFYRIPQCLAIYYSIKHKKEETTDLRRSIPNYEEVLQFSNEYTKSVDARANIIFG